MAASKYPKGLFFLVFTEFWERFGYYLMIGIFTLYMTADVSEGGFGWDNADAADIYGTFIAVAYLTPFMGGLLADLKLGYRFSITLGGILMGIGYCMLAIPEKWAFYTSLVIMGIGNGFFKPNISTLLGNLFNDERYRPTLIESLNNVRYNSLVASNVNLDLLFNNIVIIHSSNKNEHNCILTHQCCLRCNLSTLFINFSTNISGSRPVDNKVEHTCSFFKSNKLVS